jgi:hypothetical protein
MNTSQLARDLLNEVRFTAIEPETGELWEAYRTNNGYIVMRPEVNSIQRDLVTENEDEAAHYMVFISDEWTAQS